MTYYSGQTYSKRLRSQIPYYQATSKEVLHDLKLMKIDLSAKNDSFNPEVISRSRKRGKPLTVEDKSDENDALDGLISLIVLEKPQPKSQPELKIVNKPTIRTPPTPPIKKIETKSANPKIGPPIEDNRIQQMAQMQQLYQMFQYPQNAY